MISLKPLAIAVTVGCLVTSLAAQEAPATSGQTDHAAAIKQSLQASMVAIRQYEWVETTVVSVKGEEKSRTQNSCQYGADGKVQKTPIGEQPESSGKQKRGVRGRVVENKTAEMSDSVKEAVALIKQYVPPDPAHIDAAKQAGKLTVTPPDPKGMVKLVIQDYLKAGDSMTIEVNAATDRLSGLAVSTFTDSAKDAVKMNVSLGTLTDGTIYAETTDLDVEAENLAIAIENSGYKKLGG
jgi:hypothetical protein